MKYKTNPYQHQKDGVEYGMLHSSWILGDEQGLGKSKQAIDIAINKKEKCNYKHCLIVCGVNSLKWNWYAEILEHSNETPYILGQKLDKKGRLKAKTKSIADRKKEIKNIDSLPYFIITNIETFRDIEFSNIIKQLCINKKIDMCVIDECHKCKAPNSQQTKGFLKCQPEYKLAMTGTLLMNSPLDSYVTLNWLGYEKHSFYSFKNHYCIMGGYGGYQIIGYRHLDQLNRLIQDNMLRRLKKDVLDLPEKIYINEFVEMTDKQEKLYNDVKTKTINDIDKVLLSPHPLSALVRLRQCTGYTGILSSEIHESAKLDRMEELIENAVSNDDKCIIFSNWEQIADVAFDRLKKYNPVIVTGKVSEQDRKTAIDTFMSDDSCKCIIGTIGALGTGFTLTKASTIIFLDEPWTSADFNQAIDRAHRIGTKKILTIYVLMCKNTIDERVHELRTKKGEMSDLLLDNGIVTNVTELINYLLS